MHWIWKKNVMPRNNPITLPEHALEKIEVAVPELVERHALLALFVLRIVAQQVNDQANRWLGPLGLNFARYRYLVTLMREEMTVDEIAARMHTSRASVSEYLPSLESDGLIERRPNPADGRSSFVRLTTKANRLMKTAIPLHCNNIEAGMRRLSINERKQLVKLLQKCDFGSVT